MFCRVYYFETQHTAKLLETFILEGTDRLQAASACYARLLDAENAERMFKSRIRVRQTSENHRIFRALSSCQSHGTIRTQPRIRHRSNDRVDDDGTARRSRDVDGHGETCDRRAAGVDLLPSGVPERLTRDVPNVGTLCFDYTSNIRPPEDATAPSDEELHEILRAKSVLMPAVDALGGGEIVRRALRAFARPPCAVRDVDAVRTRV